jgi:hypothetical protein
MEALLSLGLIALVLSILGSLFISYSRMMLHQGNRQKSLLGCQVTAESIRRDVGSAILISIPTSDTLHIEQIDGLVTSRLPRPVPDPPPGSWSPHDPADRLKIDYRLFGTSVLRKVTLSGGATFEDNVSDEVDGLDFEILTNGNLEVVATAEIQGQLETWKVEIGHHLPPVLYP